MKKLLLSFLFIIPVAVFAQTSLIISEYVEGSSNNKAVELYNNSTSVVNLSDFVLFQFNNGATTSSGTRYALTFSNPTYLAPGRTYVIVNSAAGTALKAYANLQTSNSALNFNGDDALAIFRSSDVSGTTINNNSPIDILGQIGLDPGTEWGTGIISTADNTIRRKVSTYSGVTTNPSPFTPATEYDGFATDAFDGLGYHNMGGSITTNTSLPARAYTDLTINGSGILVSFDGPSIVSRSLTLTDGTLQSNGNLTLQSLADTTAYIAASGATATITGNVTLQRYISSKSSRAWSLISSPVSQALSTGWQQQIHITGANTGTTACTTDATTGFDVTTTNAPSAYTYDASLTAGSRWVVVPNTLSTNTAAGKGFRLNIRGPRSAGCALLDGSSLIPTAVTLSSTGTISNADKNLGSFSIIYPNAASGDNYVLAGNPYPSQISFSALRAANAAALDNTYAIYAPGNTAGNYAYWDPTGGTFAGGNNGLNNATGDIIANGQAVFLKGSAAGNVTINFAENQKTATTQNGYFRTRSFNEMIRIAYMLDDTNKADEIIVRYANDNEASNTKVGAMDIVSMNAGSQYLNSLKGNKAMAVQTRSLQTLTTDTVALNVKSSQSGTYKLNFSEYENFGATIYLIDSYTKTIHDVKASATYSFTIDKNNAATQSNRFALVFSKAIAPTVITGIKVYPNPADKQITVQLPTTTDKYTVTISDIAGKKVYQNQLSSGTQSINIAKFTKGNYVIEITDAKGNRAVEKLVKQ